MNPDDAEKTRQAIFEQLLCEAKLRKMFEELTETGEGAKALSDLLLSVKSSPLFLVSERHKTAAETRRAQFAQNAALRFCAGGTERARRERKAKDV